jgi:hypothetical protein
LLPPAKVPDGRPRRAVADCRELLRIDLAMQGSLPMPRRKCTDASGLLPPAKVGKGSARICGVLVASSLASRLSGGDSYESLGHWNQHYP